MSGRDFFELGVSCIVFVICASAHRLMLPRMYMSLLVFRYTANPGRTMKSTAIRIIYISFLSIILRKICGFGEKNIYIGIFAACFLNIWPAVIQYHLIQFWKSNERAKLLLGYILYTVFSVLFSVLSLQCVIPMLFEQKTYEILDNPVYSIILTLIGYILPVGIENILAKGSVVVNENIDSFNEKLLILNEQLQIDSDITKYYKYEVEEECEKNYVPPTLLMTIIQLEVLNRGTWFYRNIEKLVCRFAPKYAAKKDFSIGLTQIKISTAQEIIRKSPDTFLMKMFDDRFNIMLCSKLLKKLLDEYWTHSGEHEYIRNEACDEFQYIAYRYLTDCTDRTNETALLYGAILRSRVEEEYQIKNVVDINKMIHYSQDITFSEQTIIRLVFDFGRIDNRITLYTIMEKIIEDSQIEGYGILDDGLALYFKNDTEMTKMLHILLETKKMLSEMFGVDDIKYMYRCENNLYSPVG